ncbi:MAG: hypothetical protein P4M09_14645 [Devosia sp.]|nr:hypothetical protein [Devosia sp.]
MTIYQVHDMGKKVVYLVNAWGDALLDVFRACGLEEGKGVHAKTLVEVLSDWSPNILNSWNSGGAPHAGFVVDVACIMGFGPPDELVTQAKQRLDGAAASKPKTATVAYDVLDLWNDGTPECLVWKALAGGPGKLELSGGPLSLEVGAKGARGVTASEFQQVFASLKEKLTPRKPETFLTPRSKKSQQTNSPPTASAEMPSFLQRRMHAEHRSVYERLRSPEGPLLGRLMEAKLPLDEINPFVRSKGNATLYGGKSAGSAISPLDLVVQGVAFTRSQADDIANGIGATGEMLTSYTLVAQGGQGKTLALAQIINKICNQSEILVLWSFASKLSDEDHNAEDLVDDLIKTVSNAPSKIRKVVFVFDDLSRRSDFWIIRALYEAAGWMANTNVRMSFVGATADDQYSFGETTNLELTKADEASAYHAMLSHSLIVGYLGGLDKFRVDHPEKRSYTDDVQSFLSLIARHCNPTDELKRASVIFDHAALPGWKVRTLDAVAVTQTLDLSLLGSIALRVLGAVAWEPSTQISKLDDIVTSVEGINRVTGEFPGLALRSPHYARAVLEADEKLTKANFFDIVAEVSVQVLSLPEDATFPKLKMLDYFRHLLQRLGKWDVYKLPIVDRRQVAREVLKGALHNRLYDHVLATGRPEAMARWAGTVAPLIDREDFSAGLSSTTAPGFVLLFCQRLLTEKRYRNATIREAESILSLLRAASFLVPYREHALVEDFLHDLHNRVNPVKAIAKQLTKDTKGKQNYHANQVFHAFCEFNKKTKFASPWQEYVRKVVTDIERELVPIGFNFDVASDVVAANSFLYGKPRPESINRARRHLLHAYDVIISDPWQQATWRKQLKDKVVEFVEKFPSETSVFQNIIVMLS